MAMQGNNFKLLEKVNKINWTKKKMLLIGIIILGFIFVLFLFGRSNTDITETITIQSQKYSEKIVAAGQLQLDKETTLVSEVNGEIQFVGAEDGDVITAGSIFISISDTDQRFQLEQKKASYEDAESQYEHLVESDYISAKDDLKSSESQKEQAKKSFDAAVSLYREGALSQIEYMDLKADYEMALADWNTAKLKVQALGEGGTLRSSSYSKLQGSKSIYENALEGQGKYQITVPWNSVLLKMYVNEHDYVQPGDTLADIGEAGSYHVMAELDEKYFPYLMEGMKAMISMGNAGEIGDSEGFVDIITPKINGETGTFDIQIGLPSEFPYLASDLSVNIEIPIREVENAVVIPEQYLIEKESYVYLYQNGKAIKKEIKYEAGPSAKLLITDGLKPGDIIIKPSASVQDGKSVKIKRGVEAS